MDARFGGCSAEISYKIFIALYYQWTKGLVLAPCALIYTEISKGQNQALRDFLLNFQKPSILFGQRVPVCAVITAVFTRKNFLSPYIRR